MTYPISKTQLESLRRCEQYYVHRYVARKPDQMHPSARRGIRLHQVISKALEVGRAPKHPRARVLYEATPKPLLAIEKEWRWREYLGFYDAVAEGVVIDHKTVRTFKYLPKSLKTDVQARLYAGAAMAEFGWSEVKVRWQYVDAEARLQLREHTFTEVDMVDIDRDTGRIMELRGGAEPKADILSGKRGCYMYGGCQFYGDCCWKYLK